MPQSMIIPTEWLLEAGVQDFKPTRRAFRCDRSHQCIALADIEVPLRRSDYPLDANGFCHDRMVQVLIEIRDDVSIWPIEIEQADPGQRPYRLRHGMHRYHASRTLGFSHIPSEICMRVGTF
jgi:hypothetical protein